jgi:anti-anti-sigma regulatory factor
MLRITLVREAEPPTLKVEGKVSGPWVGELEHTWSEFLREGITPTVQVDLSGVTFISREGKKLLREMLEQGADLQSQSLMTQFILSQIRNESNGERLRREGGHDGFGYRAESHGEMRDVRH